MGRSGAKVWWLCPVDPEHEWPEVIGNRTSRPSHCPFCSGRRVSRDNALATVYPELAQEWHPTLNGQLAPSDVTRGSNRKVWWQCPRVPEHAWAAVIANRVLGHGCPYCSSRRVSVTNSLWVNRPDLAAQWHPTKNGPLTPDQVVVGSTKNVWWRCPEGPDHEWTARIEWRSRGIGCPFCAGKRVSVTNALARRRPDLAAQWHPAKNGGLKPDQVVTGSTRKVWWKCPEGPDHEWQTPVAYRTHPEKGTNCPYCSGRRISVTNSLASLYPDVAAEWHPTKNKGRPPEQTLAVWQRKVWWLCSADAEHEWKNTPWSRTQRKTGCPFCREIDDRLKRQRLERRWEKRAKEAAAALANQQPGQHST